MRLRSAAGLFIKVTGGRGIWGDLAKPAPDEGSLSGLPSPDSRTNWPWAETMRGFFAGPGTGRKGDRVAPAARVQRRVPSSSSEGEERVIKLDYLRPQLSWSPNVSGLISINPHLLLRKSWETREKREHRRELTALGRSAVRLHKKHHRNGTSSSQALP